jgi:hypothetical protein
VAARIVHENSAHHLRGNSEEVCFVLPVDVVLIGQTQVRLVDERGGLERVVRAFVPKLARSDVAQLRVNQRQKALECAAIAATPPVEQGDDVRRRNSQSAFSLRVDRILRL